MTGEQKLWQAVVYRALLDATAPDPKPIEERRVTAKRMAATEALIKQEYSVKANADGWIRRNSRDFRRVCSLAGMDADFVRDAYIGGKIDCALLRAAEKAVA